MVEAFSIFRQADRYFLNYRALDKIFSIIILEEQEAF
jgi:hypothetical protein